MATMSKRCRHYSIAVRPKSAPFFAVNCHLVGLQSYTSSSWPPVCRWVSALGQSRTMRQQAETVRGPYWQPMWARKDVCGLFAANVGPSAENVGPRRHVLAANVGSIAACLWARGITFVCELQKKLRFYKRRGDFTEEVATELTVPYEANFIPANRPRATCSTAASYQSGGCGKPPLRSVTVSFAIAHIAMN